MGNFTPGRPPLFSPEKREILKRGRFIAPLKFKVDPPVWNKMGEKSNPSKRSAQFLKTLMVKGRNAQGNKFKGPPGKKMLPQGPHPKPN